MGEVNGPGFKCMSPESKRVESGRYMVDLRRMFVVHKCIEEAWRAVWY